MKYKLDINDLSDCVNLIARDSTRTLLKGNGTALAIVPNTVSGEYSGDCRDTLFCENLITSAVASKNERQWNVFVHN